MKKVKFVELEKIKKLCTSMKSKIYKIESKIQKRIEYYDSKSEKWQDSNKGEEYYDFTEHLEYCSELAQEKIQEILDTVEELEDMQDE
jgi:hypothetical protein